MTTNNKYTLNTQKKAAFVNIALQLKAGGNATKDIKIGSAKIDQEALITMLEGMSEKERIKALAGTIKVVSVNISDPSANTLEELSF